MPEPQDIAIVDTSVQHTPEVQPSFPGIAIAWDEPNQRVMVNWDGAYFKTFDFLLACLEMARIQVDEARKDKILEGKILAAQHQQQAAAVGQHRANQIKRNLRGGGP